MQRRVFLLLVLLAWPVWADGPGKAPRVLSGPVLKVIDGDTVRVKVDGRSVAVRLHGVDAPESDQAFGAAATRALRQRVDRRTVVVSVVERDRYGREVGVLYLDGKVVNAELVEGGFAWAYRQYLDNPPASRDYCRLEAEARKARRGLWSQAPAKIVPPWQYRARRHDDKLVFTQVGDLSLANCLDAIPRRRGR